MSLIKFMTICDDENFSLVSFDRLKTLDISVYPTMYFCDETPFYDTLNTDVNKYNQHIESGAVITEPSISPNIFEYEFNKAYINGYLAIVVVFPHCKWTSYRKSAEIAKKRFLRKISIDEQGFDIKFINSRAFGADLMLQTIQLAELYGHFHYTVAEFLSFVKFLDKKRVSFVLSYGKNKLSSENDYAAFIIRENRLFPLNICQYPESVMFDKFAQAVCQELEKYNLGYTVSVGYNCSFYKNIVGRIEIISSKIPKHIINYGLPSATVFGSNAFCISILQ